MFDMENRGPGDGKPGVIFVREKRRQASRKPETGKVTLKAGG
jgi:hypothetical protein